ncbi:MAG: putative Ig domain-containing protein [Coleofasciculus sp. G3-WIS-01]|uniref:putative Ig domain-containing protein n=1 Tax=Coleofasciculus sp. G3-WIS-01 TaxID=3069528 RepID=UPI0032FDAB38
MPQQLIVTNTKNNGSGSLRDAISLAQSGDTIKFSSSLAGKTITLRTGQLEIRPGKNITIDGADAPGLRISGNKQSRLFFVNSNQDFNASLTLKNLNLINGYTKERGGAIEITHQGALTVDNVQFKNNVADNGGGAIYSAWETELTINGSTFDKNKAVAGNDERGAGAIAFVSPGKFTVTNSEFTNNQGINGGAINSLQGKLTIENSKFINNNTTAAFYDKGNKNPSLRGYGGAVYTDRASSGSDSTSGTIRIINSVFDGNKGRAEGGAAYLYTGTQDNVSIQGSLFKNNEVLALPNGGNKGNGGAVVQLSNGLNKGLVVRDTTFANNKAAHQGGALWTYDAPTKIINSTFSGNQTTGDTSGSVGGGMTLYSPTEITNSTIAYNNASWVGGGVSAGKNAKVSVKNTIFYKNTADNGTNDWGIQQHTNKELIDKGGNVQFPPKATKNWNDYNATAGIKIIDAQLNPLQDNGGLVPTHTVGNPLVKVGALLVNSGLTGGGNVINTAPLLVTAIADQTAEVDESFTLDITNKFSDTDGKDLTYSATLKDGGELPSWLSFDPDQGTFTGTPNSGDETLNILVTASDSQGGTKSDGFKLDIAAAPVVNNDPTLLSPIADQTVEVDESFRLNITNKFSDADGDRLTYSATLKDGGALPSWLSFDPDKGIFRGTPNNGDETLNILVTASDSQGGTKSDGFKLDIAAAPVVNNDPTLLSPIADQTAQTKQFYSLDISDYFTDPDGDSLTYSAIGLPKGLNLNPETGLISGNLRNKAVGTNSITLTANDGNGGEISDVFDLTVNRGTRNNGNAKPQLSPQNDWLDSNQFTLNGQNPMAEGNQSLTLTGEPTNESPVLGTQLQGEKELIDLRGQTSPVEANFIEIKSEARFDNSVGLYVIENEEGAVKDPMTGQLIHPGNEGYAQAALAQRVVSDVNRGMVTFNTQLQGGSLLAPYIIANGTTEEWLTENSTNQYLGYGEPIAYFAYLGANPDKVDHIRLLGDNTFGFEDLHGGGDNDFNDLTFQVDLTVA